MLDTLGTLSDISKSNVTQKIDGFLTFTGLVCVNHREKKSLFSKQKSKFLPLWTTT